jgi:hypothetical protein
MTHVTKPMTDGLFSFPIFSASAVHRFTMKRFLLHFPNLWRSAKLGAGFTGDWGGFSMAGTSSAETGCLAKYCPPRILGIYAVSAEYRTNIGEPLP